MAQDVLETLEHALAKFSGPEEIKIKTALIDGIRATFAQVASWFQVPQTGFVPASISDICRIIDIEFGRIGNATVVEGDLNELKYFGISVHRLYDCLAVLLQNAFKHGCSRSSPIVNVTSQPISGTKLHDVRISVLSVLRESDAVYCEQRVSEAILSSETGRDMVTEGYSGIKKVKFITKMNEGVPTVSHTVVGDTMEIRFTIKAEVASEREAIEERTPSRG